MNSFKNIKSQDIEEDQWYIKGITSDVLNITFPVTQNAKSIGRSKDSNICLPIIRLSRTHARLSQQDDGILVEDLGSSNGTYVNGKKILTLLAKHGDTVSFDNVAFRVTSPNINIHLENTVMGAGVFSDQTVVRAKQKNLSSKSELSETQPTDNTIQNNSDNHQEPHSSLIATKKHHSVTAEDLLEAQRKKSQIRNTNSAIEKQKKLFIKSPKVTHHLSEKHLSSLPIKNAGINISFILIAGIASIILLCIIAFILRH